MAIFTSYGPSEAVKRPEVTAIHAPVCVCVCVRARARERVCVRECEREGACVLFVLD